MYPNPSDVTRVVFSNGLTVLVRENHAAPVAVLQGSLAVGSMLRHPGAGRAGELCGEPALARQPALRLRGLQRDDRERGRQPDLQRRHPLHRFRRDLPARRLCSAGRRAGRRAAAANLSRRHTSSWCASSGWSTCRNATRTPAAWPTCASTRRSTAAVIRTAVPPAAILRRSRRSSAATSSTSTSRISRRTKA